MTRLARLIAIFVGVMAWTSYGEETSSVKCRIVSQHSDVEVVWVGVFVGPMRPESEAWIWTSVESNKFSLKIPDTEEEVLVVALRKNSVPITVKLTPESRNSELPLDFKRGVVLSGSLVSTDGIVVPDAVLTVERRDGILLQIPSQAQFEWSTDANGTYSIGGLAAGRYAIQVATTHMPAERFSIRVAGGEDKQRDLVLSDAHHVLGRVVDHVGEASVGAVVSARLDPPIWQDTSGNVVLGADMGEAMKTFGRLDFHPSNSMKVQSDSTGSFQMGPFVYGQGMEMSASHNDGGSTSRTKVFSGNHEIILMLSKMVEVFGNVVVAATGAPIEQFTVEVRGPSTSEFRYSDASGRFSERIDTAASSIVIRAPTYIPYVKTNLDLGSLDEYDMEFIELEPGTQLTGRVLDLHSRRPVEGATLASLGRDIEGESPPGRSLLVSRLGQGIVKARSDADGRFLLKPVPVDTFVLHVEAYGYKPEEFVVEPQASPLDIGLSPRDIQNTKIVGRIQTTAGESVVGTVTIQEVDTGLIKITRSNNDGRFEYFAHEGPHKVRAVSNSGRSKTVDLSVSDGKIEEIVLIVNPFGRLEGSISGLKHAEQPFVTIHSGEKLVQATGNVSNGKFVLEGMGTGPFTVRVRTSMNRQRERSFELTEAMDEAFVEISFDGDSRLYGRVLSLVDADSNLQVRAIARDKGSVVGWSDILDDGSYEIFGLVDGDYLVEVGEEKTWGIVENDSKSRSRRVETAVAGDTELNIDFTSPNSHF